MASYREDANRVPETQTNEIEAAREALQRAAADQTFKRRRPQSKTKKIRELRPEIVKLRSQGRTWQDIADALDGTLAASADTIRLAIGSKVGSKKRTTRSSAPPAPSPAAPPTTGSSRRAARDAEPEPPSPPALPKKRFGPPEL